MGEFQGFGIGIPLPGIGFFRGVGSRKIVDPGIGLGIYFDITFLAGPIIVIHQQMYDAIAFVGQAIRGGCVAARAAIKAQSHGIFNAFGQIGPDFFNNFVGSALDCGLLGCFGGVLVGKIMTNFFAHGTVIT